MKSPIRDREITWHSLSKQLGIKERGKITSPAQAFAQLKPTQKLELIAEVASDAPRNGREAYLQFMGSL